jgi:hypothetical protein
MSTMVERVARAMHEAVSPATPWEPKDDGYYQAQYTSARAAIGAMMEPTSKMLDAAADEEDRRGYFSHENLIAEEVWPIMVKAALEEKA